MPSSGLFYIIDGYNLLFSLADSKQHLKTLRETLIRFLQKKFSQHSLSGTIVFDGSHRREEESGLSYASPLEIAYAPKGESADEYILTLILSLKNPRQAIAVTNDRGLTLHIKSLGAKSLSNNAFLKQLQKKRKRGEIPQKEVVDTKRNLDRLLKIFEEKLLHPEDLN